MAESERLSSGVKTGDNEKMTELRLYDAIYSLQRFFDDRLGIRADWKYDGYQYPSQRPFITIEALMDERITLSKQREAVQVIDHLQIGYHATNIVDRTQTAEKIADLLTFEEIPYFNTQESVAIPSGFFVVEVASVTPISPDDISNKSEYHRVYFDVEIEKIKRRR